MPIGSSCARIPRSHALRVSKLAVYALIQVAVGGTQRKIRRQSCDVMGACLASLLLAMDLIGCGQVRPAGVGPTSGTAVSNSRSNTPSPSNQPIGIPDVYGWDGVNNRILMTGVGNPFTGAGADQRTWTFLRGNWLPVEPNAALPGWPGSPGFLVFDSRRNREMYFVTSGIVCCNFTWEWDGQSWRNNTGSDVPTYMGQWSNFAYSPVLQATVMLTPDIAAPLPTWIYDGNHWRSIQTAHAPRWGSSIRLAYDPARKSIVALTLADYRTWVFDGQDWNQLPLQGPTPQWRASPAVAFDPDRSLWVVFGGGIYPKALGDTWTSDGGTWARHTTPTAPKARASWDYGTLVFDTAQHRMILFGGTTDNQVVLGDTWAWDGKAWTQLAGSVYR